MAKKPTAGEYYQNFKSPKKQYLVIGLAKHSETLEEMVIYEALYDNPQGKIWTRPLAMWDEIVDRPEYNYQGPRFIKINSPITK